MGPVAGGGKGEVWEYPLVWCSCCTGLGAVKVLTIRLAVLGVKDVQDLLAVPLQASSSSPVYVLQLYVCLQHTSLATDFQSLPFGRVRNPSVRLDLSLVSG